MFNCFFPHRPQKSRKKSNLSKVIEDLNSILTQCVNDRDDAQAEVAQMKIEKENLQSTIDDVSAKVSTLKEEVKELNILLEESMHSKENAHGEAIQLKKEKEILQVAVDDSSAMVSNLVEKVKELNVLLEESTKCKKYAEDEVVQLKNEKKTLQSCVNSSTARVTNLERKVGDLTLVLENCTKGNLKIASRSNPNLASLLLQNLHTFELTDLRLYHQDVTIEEYSTLAANNMVTFCLLYKVLITHDNGDVVPFENLFEELSNVKAFFFDFSERNKSCVTKTTTKYFAEQIRFKNLERFELCEIPECFDLLCFNGFMKKHQKASFLLHFKENLPMNVKRKLENDKSKLFKTWMGARRPDIHI